MNTRQKFQRLKLCGRALLTAMLFFAVSSVFADVPSRVINIMAGVHSYDMNPHTADYTNEAQLFTGLYEGLFSYDPVNLSPTPALCESYTISRNKKRWTFTMRSGAKFSDGTPIEASDVRDSWLALLSTPGAPFASLLDCIEGAAEYRLGEGSAEDVRIEARDPSTLVVHLKENASHLPRVLCHHAFAVVSKSEGVYSGAFVLESATQSEITLKKNENYWDAQNVRIPGIKITLSDDSEENSHLFNDGKADWLAGNADYSVIIDKSKIQTGTEFGTTYLFFKLRGSYWDKQEFREALLEATPFDVLRQNYTIKAETFIYPLPGYPSVSGFSDYDAQDAKELMDAAREKYGVPPDERLSLTFASTPDEYMLNWASTLKEAWEPLGVDLQIQTTPADRYNSSIPAWNADLFSYSWIGDFADPLAFLELFRGDSSLNVARFRNDEYDGLLEEASRTEETSERYRLMADAEEILLNECEVIPISHGVSAHVIDLNQIGGWQTNALDLHPLKSLYIKSLPQTKAPNIVYKPAPDNSGKS